MTETVDPPAVFDAEAASSLTGHPDDRAFGVVFVTRYRGLLPERVRRIATALASDELDEAMDAVLSLKVSSCTAGTQELAEIAARIERLLRRGDFAQAVVMETALAEAAARAEHALAAFLAN
jgi:HPt (histidine-containing phosphotransfer) domain-containing protein